MTNNLNLRKHQAPIVHKQEQYGIRHEAEEFPLMVVISVIYPCNFGCPNCPYTDSNSQIRRFYHEQKWDLFPIELWKRVADECGENGSWMRCSGGGEPMLHPQMVEMIEYAKDRGARIWLNTNGSMFGPSHKLRQKLERIIRAGVDLIEFSMDASDAETYAKVRPLRHGPPSNPKQWWKRQVDNVHAALDFRKKLRAPSRVVVSLIQQKEIEEKLEETVNFWIKEIGVDEVITRKFLTWDDNTTIPFNKSLDPHLYSDLPTQKKEPCVWPFERLNVDTLGRIALCGQDISFRTSKFFPNAWETSIKEIWNGGMFNWYRQMHLNGNGAECFPCRGCSAWFAGVRDWEYGWLNVLKNSGEHLKEVMANEPGVEVKIYEPQKKVRL